MTGRRGFTIVEVMIAILIFSLGILGLVSTAATVTRMVGRSQQYDMAASLAQQRMEILKATACGGMVTGSATSGRYSTAWTVTDVTGGKQVVVTVTSPTTRGNKNDTFTMITSCTS